MLPFTALQNVASRAWQLKFPLSRTSAVNIDVVKHEVIFRSRYQFHNVKFQIVNMLCWKQQQNEKWINIFMIVRRNEGIDGMMIWIFEIDIKFSVHKNITTISNLLSDWDCVLCYSWDYQCVKSHTDKFACQLPEKLICFFGEKHKCSLATLHKIPNKISASPLKIQTKWQKA